MGQNKGMFVFYTFSTRYTRYTRYTRVPGSARAGPQQLGFLPRSKIYPVHKSTWYRVPGRG